MHDRVRRQLERDAFEGLKEEAREMARRRNLPEVEELLVPTYPGRIRRDPAMVQTYNAQNLHEAYRQINEYDRQLESLGAMNTEVETAPVSLRDVDGVGEELAEKLKEAGFHTVEDLKNANEEDLIAVDGVGKSKAAKLKAL